MNNASIKSAASKAMVLGAAVVALVGFAAVTQRAEQSAVRALDSAVAAPGKLYLQPAPATAQLATVVITTKRPS